MPWFWKSKSPATDSKSVGAVKDAIILSKDQFESAKVKGPEFVAFLLEFKLMECAGESHSSSAVLLALAVSHLRLRQNFRRSF
jgi:hypothetical protein